MADVAPGTTISPAFEQVVRKALAKRPDERFKDAEQMQAALERVRRDLGALANDFTPPPAEITSKMASRADFDRFERRLRWQRIRAPLLALTLVGVSVYGAYTYWTNKKIETPVSYSSEREPNDHASVATPISLGVEVSGTIGPASSDGKSDRDVYLVKGLARVRAPLRLSVTGVPDLNLSIAVSELYAQGAGPEKLRRRVFVDDVGVGEPERVDGYWPEPGSDTLYVSIEEGPHFSEAARLPREKSQVPYKLKVVALTGERVTEREPNDSSSLATEVNLERAVTAFTGALLAYPPPRLGHVRPNAPTFSSPDYFMTRLMTRLESTGVEQEPPREARRARIET